MKKSLLVVFLAVIVISLFVSCGNDPFFHTVTVINDKNNNVIESQIIYDNDVYRLPSSPNFRGYVFDGWKLDGGGSYKSGDSIRVTKDLTFKTVWGDEIKAPVVTSVDKTTTYSGKDTITLPELTTAGEQYQWTTNGSEPSATNGNAGREIELKDSAGIVIIKVVTIKTVEKEGKEEKYLSETSSFTLNVKPSIDFNFENNEVVGDDEPIKITVPKGTTVYYTTDGTDPQTSETKQEYKDSEGFYLDPQNQPGKDVTIKVYAEKDKIEETGEIKVKVKYSAPKTQDFEENKDYTQNENITVKVPAGTTTIYYTTDGTDPTNSTTVKNVPVDNDGKGEIPLNGVSGQVPVRIITKDSEGRPSKEEEITVKVQPTKPVAEDTDYSETPYEPEEKFTIKDLKEDEFIHFTTDGTDPESSITKHEIKDTDGDGKIEIPLEDVSGNVTIKVVTIKDDVPSDPETFTIKVKPSVQFEDEGGTPLNDSSGVAEDEPIKIKVPEGTTVYYTTDGSDPQTSETKQEYKDPDGISVTGKPGDIKIKVYAEDDGIGTTKDLLIKVKPNTPTTDADETKTYSQTENIKVTVSEGTIGYYTFDGTDPTTSSPAVPSSGEIPLDGQFGKVKIKVIAVKDGVASLVKEINVKVKPKKPAYTGDATIAHEATEKIPVVLPKNADLYYTTDGTDPETSITKHEIKDTDGDGKIELPLEDVSGNVTIKAIVVKDAVPSDPETFTIKVKPPVQFEEEGGTVIKEGSGVVEDEPIKIKVPEGTTVYYTTDGSDPQTSETKQEYKDSDGISVTGQSGEITIKVYAEEDGIGTTKEIKVTIKPAAPKTPDFDETKNYGQDEKIKVKIVPGTTVYYTTNGGDPTTTSTGKTLTDPDGDGTGEIPLTEFSGGVVTIKMITKQGDETSPVKEIEVKVKPNKPEAKEATEVAPETVHEPEDKITINTYKTVRYTTDGSDPTTSPTVKVAKDTIKYDGLPEIPLEGVAGNVIVKVIIVTVDGVPSDTTTFTIKVKPPVQFEDEDGTILKASSGVAEDEPIKIKVPEGTIVYYTTDGTDPQTSETKQEYKDSDGISVTGKSGEITIKVYAEKDGFETTKEIKVNVKPSAPKTPDFDETKTYNQNETIRVQVVPAGATVFYTTDGTDPTTSTTKKEIKDSDNDGEEEIPLSGGAGEVSIRIVTKKDGDDTYTKDKSITVKVKPTIEFDHKDGDKVAKNESIIITSQEGVTVYYTMDNTDPETSETKKTYIKDLGIPLSTSIGDKTIKVYAVKDEIGATSSLSITVIPVAPEPTADETKDYAPEETIIVKVPAGATLYYTTDNSDPTASSEVKEIKDKDIDGEIKLPLNEVLGKVPIKMILKEGTVSSEVKSITVKVKPAISFNFNNNDVVGEEEKIVVTASEGATVYYTTDDSDPAEETNESRIEGNEISLSEVSTGTVKTIRAYAVKDEVGETKDLTVTVKAAPTTSVDGEPEGTIHEKNDVVEVPIPEGGTIYYTTDESDPTTSTTKQEAKDNDGDGKAEIPLETHDGQVIIKIISQQGSETSAVKKVKIKVKFDITFSHNEGAVVKQDEAITVKVPEDTIVIYTTDGSEPTKNNGTLYSSVLYPTGLAGDVTIKVYANKDGVEATSALKIKVQPAVPNPVVDETRDYTPDEIIRVGMPSGSTIYYTTDGTDPTTSSTGTEIKDLDNDGFGELPLEGFPGKEVIIKMIVKQDGTSSEVKEIKVKVVPSILFNYEEGSEVLQNGKITIITSDGAEVYYTTDGSEPTAASTKYTEEGISLADKSGSTTIKAYAVKNEIGATKALTITVKPLAPTTSVDDEKEGTVHPQTDGITVKVPVEGTVFYTIDGTDPTTSPTKKEIKDSDNDGEEKISLSGGAGEVSIRIVTKEEGDDKPYSEEQLVTVWVQPPQPTYCGGDSGPYGVATELDFTVPDDETETYYTLDGTDPKPNEGTTKPAQNGKIPLQDIPLKDEDGDGIEDVTVKVISVKDGIPSDPTTMEVKVQIKKLKITYQLNGGTVSSGSGKVSGDIYSEEVGLDANGKADVTFLSAVSKSGYFLDGWYASEPAPGVDFYEAGTTKTLAKSMTLYAHWIDNKADYIVLDNYTKEDGTKVYGTEAGVLKNNNTSGHVTVASVYHGLPVTVAGAFYQPGDYNSRIFGFYGSNIKSISLPDTITEIGNAAFREVDLSESINIPESVTTIGVQAFYSSPETTITLPESIKVIKNLSLTYSKVETINLPEGLEKIESSAFDKSQLKGSITIPSTVKELGDFAFSDCHYITEVEIKCSLPDFEYAFCWCENLKTVKITGSMKTLGNSAFFKCSSLTTVELPKSLTKIEKSAFYNCTALTEITIPENVTEMAKGRADGPFIFCDNLKTIYVRQKQSESPLAADTSWAITGGSIDKPTYANIVWLKDYMITYLDADGTELDSKDFNAGETVTLATPPERDGYVFAGWYTQDGSYYGFSGYEVAPEGKDITLYAKWRDKNYIYKIGDIGPAGGHIFYDAGSTQVSTYKDATGKTVEFQWRYLELAPAESEIECAWGGPQGFSYLTDFGVGTGKGNTEKFKEVGIEYFPAAQACVEYSGGGYTDWFLPSYDELCLARKNCRGRGLSFWVDYYWTSTTTSRYAFAVLFHWNDYNMEVRSNKNWVRPIRAFL